MISSVAVIFQAAAQVTNPPTGPLKPDVISEAGISNLVVENFPRWDLDHDGCLTTNELDAAIVDPAVKGKRAALAVILRRDILEPGWSQTQIAAHLNDPVVKPKFSALCRQAVALGRLESQPLFLPGEPRLESFHQGRVGDCLLLSRIAALVHHKPGQVRGMISPSGDGYEVSFACGTSLFVPRLTDGEMLLPGANRNRTNNGVWLSVLEKGSVLMLAKIAAERGTTNVSLPRITLEANGKSHLYNDATPLLTGHKQKYFTFGTNHAASAPAVLDRLSDLLSETLRDKRLAIVGTPADVKVTLPKGIPHNHAFAILEYDRERRRVTVFNPWGNTFKPVGPPGLVNGYPTTAGVFEVPLDELVQIYRGLRYETSEPSPFPLGKT